METCDHSSLLEVGYQCRLSNGHMWKTHKPSSKCFEFATRLTKEGEGCILCVLKHTLALANTHCTTKLCCMVQWHYAISWHCVFCYARTPGDGYIQWKHTRSYLIWTGVMFNGKHELTQPDRISQVYQDSVNQQLLHHVKLTWFQFHTTTVTPN